MNSHQTDLALSLVEIPLSQPRDPRTVSKLTWTRHFWRLFRSGLWISDFYSYSDRFDFSSQNVSMISIYSSLLQIYTNQILFIGCKLQVLIYSNHNQTWQKAFSSDSIRNMGLSKINDGHTGQMRTAFVNGAPF